MAKAGTVREARSNVVTAARAINAQYAEKGDVDSSLMTDLTASISLLDERTAASNAKRKAEK